jgi:hypothetical protein
MLEAFLKRPARVKPVRVWVSANRRERDGSNLRVRVVVLRSSRFRELHSTRYVLWLDLRGGGGGRHR